jgi:hypothetical protein
VGAQLADAGVGPDRPYAADMGVGPDRPYAADMGVGPDRPYAADMGVGPDRPYMADMGVGTDEPWREAPSRKRRLRGDNRDANPRPKKRARISDEPPGGDGDEDMGPPAPPPSGPAPPGYGSAVNPARKYTKRAAAGRRAKEEAAYKRDLFDDLRAKPYVDVPRELPMEWAPPAATVFEAPPVAAPSKRKKAQDPAPVALDMPPEWFVVKKSSAPKAPLSASDRKKVQRRRQGRRSELDLNNMIMV